MKYISLPDAKIRRLSFYLAMEEYVARHIDEPEAFFLWQVHPSVIFGRNQLLESEVNVSYCREHGIEMYRRKSGGGCVYADELNIMLSYVTKTESVDFAFQQFLGMVVLAFRRMGVEAAKTSHNDVLLPPLGQDGAPAQPDEPWRKVCGTACYHLPGCSVVHSTLLYDTCMEHMQNAITPGPEKLQQKGIQSVRQRITFLKDYVSLSIDEVKSSIRSTLCVGERQLTEDDVAAIEELEQTYLREEFIHLIH